MEWLAKRHREQLKREDRRAGEIIAILFNVNRDTQKVPNGIEWTDVFPEWKEVLPTEEQTEEEMLNMMLMFTKQREDQSH